MDRDEHGNVPRPEHYTQVCILPGVILTDDQRSGFTALMAELFNGVRVVYMEEIESKPDRTPFGTTIEGTGGVNLIVFAVHNEDVMRFAVPRFAMAIRWVEDFMADDTKSWVPDRFHQYMSWDASISERDMPR